MGLNWKWSRGFIPDAISAHRAVCFFGQFFDLAGKAVQHSLFNSSEPLQVITGSGDVRYYPDWLAGPEADIYFTQLRREIAWQQSHIRIQGRELPIPRLNAWYGEPDTAYSYSGIHFEPLTWTNALLRLKRHVETFVSARFDLQQPLFNSALVNCYRDGNDSVAWHADDEPELGAEPLIASISLGASRRFQLKPRRAGVSVSGKTIALDLASGSLVLMRGKTPANWWHQIPKTRASVGERINVTYRWIFSAQRL